MFSIFLIVWADLFNLPCWCQMWSGWDQIQPRNDSFSRKLPPQARHLKYHRVLLWRQHWLPPYSPLLEKRRKQYDALHLLISATAAVYEHLFLSGLHGHKSPETGFLHEVSGISLRHEVGNLAFGRMLEVELLFLTFWYGQLRRFRHLIGMPGGWNSRCMCSWEEPWRTTHNWLDGLLDYPTWNTSGTFVGAWMCWSGWWRPEYPTQPVGTEQPGPG